MMSSTYVIIWGDLSFYTIVCMNLLYVAPKLIGQKGIRLKVNDPKQHTNPKKGLDFFSTGIV